VKRSKVTWFLEKFGRKKWGVARELAVGKKSEKEKSGRHKLGSMPIALKMSVYDGLREQTAGLRKDFSETE